MNCPQWEKCFHEECCSDRICRNKSFWRDFWTERGRREWEEQQAEGITKKERRKARKTLKKIKGIKRFNREEKQKAFSEIYAQTPPCTKDCGGCDKREACDVLNECLVNISRIAQNKLLVDCLRGPLNLKQIITVLQRHDPEPMRSYYPLNLK